MKLNDKKVITDSEGWRKLPSYIMDAQYFAKKSLCFKIVKQQIHFTFIFFNLLPMHKITEIKRYKNDKNKTKTPVFKTVNFKLQYIL